MNVRIQIVASLFCVLMSFGLLPAQPGLFFQVDNERVVTHPTLGSAFAVDVSMHASYSGTYHSRGLLYLKYDTTRFGSRIDNRNAIAYEHGTLLDGTVNFLGQLRPRYLTVNVIDNVADVVALTWESEWLSFLPNPLVHNEVPDTLTTLYTVYFKIINTPAAGDVEIHFPLMPNQQFYITDTNGDGFPDEVPYGTIGVFPVEWLDFQAVWQSDQSVEISWATASEMNNDYFEIQKRHGNGIFFPIGQVDCAKNSDVVHSYHWIDQTEHSDINYYRIRQVDTDGKSSFSDVIQLETNNPSPNLLFPSPTSGLLYIHGSPESVRTIIITDVSGKILQKNHYQFLVKDTIQIFDLSTFANGVYFVQIMDEKGHSQSQKIFKSQP